MLQIGSLLDGKYKILNEIGHGGMSVVYMALNEKANKTWAVKEIRKDGKLDFNTVKQGLVAEIETLKKLNHPNIPSVIDVIEDEESFIIVMDYIEGNSLDKALEEHGVQPQEYVVKWALQLCDALGYLHSLNPPIIYRDMKPANIMLKPDGNITLIDFGTAKTYEINLGETTGIGTIGYAAPEQYIGSGLGRTDARTDIYCLGITLYHLLTGVDPCKYVISNRSIRAVNPALSAGLDEIIIKCTQTNADDRYQSCAELYYDLEHHAQKGKAYRKKQRRKLFSFLFAVILSVGFAGTAVFGHICANNKKDENYNTQIENANSPDLSQEKRKECYLEAIKIDATRTEAYLNMIDMFLSGNKNTGTFDKSEAATLVQLKAGIDKENSAGFLETIHPFEDLKKENPKGYVQVCNEIGFAYWYDYEIENDRQSQAVEWFDETKEKNAIAKIYCDIGENRYTINKYEDEKRPEATNQAYRALWQNLQNLNKEGKSLEGLDIKILVWDEIVHSLNSKLANFIENTGKAEIEDMLKEIKSDVEKVRTDNQSQSVMNFLNEILKSIDETEVRINSSKDGEE